MNVIHLTKEQVEQGEHRRYNPDRYDFRWNADYTECDVIALLWCDEASYREHQGEPLPDLYPAASYKPGHDSDLPF